MVNYNNTVKQIKDTIKMYSNFMDEDLKKESIEIIVEEAINCIDCKNKNRFNKLFSAIAIEALAYNFKSFFDYPMVEAETSISILLESIHRCLRNWDRNKAKFMSFLFIDFRRQLSVENRINNYDKRKLSNLTESLDNLLINENSEIDNYEKNIYLEDKKRESYRPIFQNIDLNQKLSFIDKKILKRIIEGYPLYKISIMEHISFPKLKKILNKMDRELIEDLINID